MKSVIRRKLANRKRRSERRLDQADLRGCSQPMMTARTIHYEIAERGRGIGVGGLGAMHALVRRLGLMDALGRRLEVLKAHLPYRESDHVPALAYLPLCGGTRLRDLELLRHDEVLLDALGARRLPDPTTAGAFCRRLSPEHIRTLLDVFGDTRCRVWADQPPTSLERAIVDMDGFLVEATGPCKQGMDSASDGTWGYHALVLTLANTGEVPSVVNRPPAIGPQPRGPPLRWTGPCARASAGAFTGPCGVATRSSRRPDTWTAGTTTRASTSSSASRPMPI